MTDDESAGGDGDMEDNELIAKSELELNDGTIVPFVAVKSSGGKFDDLSYVSGFELGRLDVFMSYGNVRVIAFINEDNLQQADLIAMAHDFTTVNHGPHPNINGLIHVEFIKSGAEIVG